MSGEGPALDSLTHRLADCPEDFLAEPLIGRSGQVHVRAVVNDTMLNLGGRLARAEGLTAFSGAGDRNRLRLVLVACWLLNDPWFTRRKCFSGPAFTWLADGLTALASAASAGLFVTEPDRREELARLCLAALGLRPAGENAAQAADRLATLDSVEHARVMRDMQEKQRRARELREQMRRREAEEAAAKVTRE